MFLRPFSDVSLNPALTHSHHPELWECSNNIISITCFCLQCFIYIMSPNVTSFSLPVLKRLIDFADIELSTCSFNLMAVLLTSASLSCSSFAWRSCPEMIFLLFFYYNQPTSWRSARPRAARGEGQLPPWGPGVHFKEVRLYWKSNFPLFYCFEMSPSARSSAAVSSTRSDEGMLPDRFCSWLTGSHYAAFMRWISVLFPAVLGVSMTKTSKDQ